jgi:general secretion pathway protein B
MSSILKALKKLEEEKSARRAGVDVARGIVMGIPVRPRKRRWLFPVSVAGAAFSAALLTYILVGGPPNLKLDTEQLEVSRSQSDVGKAGTEINRGKSAAVEEKLQPVGEPSETSASRPVSEPATKVPVKKISPVEGSSLRLPEIPADVKIPDAQRLKQKNLQLSGNNSSGTLPQPASIPLPSLRVSGIAWDRGGSERFAVVNGTSVSEGMKVGGAVVERIFEDKVRFSFENRTFDVAVGNEMR